MMIEQIPANQGRLAIVELYRTNSHRPRPTPNRGDY